VSSSLYFVDGNNGLIVMTSTPSMVLLVLVLVFNEVNEAFLLAESNEWYQVPGTEYCIK